MLRQLTYAVAVLAATSALAWQAPKLQDKTQSSVPATGAAASGPTLSVSARLVNLPVIVRDKKGAFVPNLTRADFSLSIDGHPETIRYFDRDNNLPLTLGLLVDTSMSQHNVLDEERTASGAFLEQMLTAAAEPPDKAHPPDQAFVIQFAHEAELLQDLTSSRPKLQAALKEIDTTSSTTQPDPTTNTDDSPGHRGSRHGGTTLYDAIFLSADELMAKQQGRKALVVLSDGVDNGSRESLTRSIESAQRADTVVYAIYFKGEEHHGFGNDGGGGGRSHIGIGFPGGGYPGGGGRNGGGGTRGGNESHIDGKKILERIAGETGGRLFEVSKKQNVASIYTQIAEELRSQYRLGYTPDAATSADGYHKVALTTPKQEKLIVQTRDGYYSGK